MLLKEIRFLRVCFSKNCIKLLNLVRNLMVCDTLAPVTVAT